MIEEIKKILVPLDGSELAEAAIPVAQQLAKCLGAALVLLHILEEKPPQRIHGQPHLRTVADAEAYFDRLRTEIAGLQPAEHHVHAIEEVNVAASIAAHAAELDAGIVAICTHGRSGLRRIVGGSIAQLVLQRSNVPVLLIRPRNSAGVPSFDHVLVPLNGNAEAEEAIPWAELLARKCGAQLELVGVVPTLATVAGERSASARLIPSAAAIALDEEEAQIGDYLSRKASTMVREGMEVTSNVLRGETVQMLAEAARQRHADLTIIATHARAGLNSLWSGSVAAAYVNRVDQPVLLVRVAESSQGSTAR